MKKSTFTRALSAATVLGLCVLPAWSAEDEDSERPGVVHCANLVYGGSKTSKCFADHFLADVQKQTHIWTARQFDEVRSDSADLFNFPFAVMSGEGAFRMTDPERDNLRRYLLGGGFLMASPGCSSDEWKKSFEAEAKELLPDLELQKLDMSHPVFRTVYQIDELKTKKKGVVAQLYGVIYEGRVVMIYSPDGLNDTPNAGGSCCCCGGNEILNSRQMNANLLVYALTH